VTRDIETLKAELRKPSVLAAETGMKLDALEYIETLETRCDVLLKGLEDAFELIGQINALLPRWIPMKEQLPPKGKYVLAANGHGYVTKLALRYRDEVNDRWTWVGDGHIWHFNDITHWVPLPNAPGRG